MSNVLTTYTLDTSQPQAELEKYRKGVVALTSEEEKALIKASATAKTRAADLKREEKALRELMKLRKETNNPTIIKQYDEQIKKTVGSIQRLNKETRGTANEIKKVGTEVKKLGGVQGTLITQLKQIGTAAAAAFTARAIFNFGKEAVQLAATLEGVQRAFTQLGGTQANIDALTKATRGTVAEVELLQVAVRAKNFGIAFEQLPGLLQFATDRAIQTGQSVDYLVNSIVDGIGRKSTLVIDNLGISAASLQEEIKKTGDFAQAVANLIEVEMGKAGEVLDTTATKTQILNTSFKNLKTEIGQFLAPVVSQLADELNILVKGWTALITGVSKADQEELVNTLESLSFTVKQIANDIDGTTPRLEKYIEAQRSLGRTTLTTKDAQLELLEAYRRATVGVVENERGTRTFIEANKQLIPVIEQLIKKLTDPKLKAGTDTLASLQKELAEEQELLATAFDVGTAAFFNQAAKVDRLKARLEALSDPLKAAREAEEAARKEREAAEKAIDGLIQGLEKQRDQLTMTNEEILRNELAQLGANEATIFSTLQLRAQVEELKNVEAAKKAQIALGEQLTASVLTDAEKEKMAIEEVNEAYANNVISFETMMRRREQIQDEADERQQKALDDEAKRQADSMKLKEDFLNEFAKSNREVLKELIDALLLQAKVLFETTDMTLEEYTKLVKGINNLLLESSAGTAEQLFSDLSGAIDGMKEFLNVVGGDSAKFLMFQKVLTGIQIALDTAAAISSVIKYASGSSPDPVTLAAKIAAGVGIVLANMAAAITLFKGAPDATAPTYAKGGYTGTGIGRKDHTGETVAGVVHAKEFVINKGETAKYKPMLEAINKGKWPEYFARHYAPFAAIDARPSKAADKGFAANIAKALQIEFDDRLEGALKRIERKTGTTKVTNLHELGKYFKRNYWGPNTKGN